MCLNNLYQANVPLRFIPNYNDISNDILLKLQYGGLTHESPKKKIYCYHIEPNNLKALSNCKVFGKVRCHGDHRLYMLSFNIIAKNHSLVFHIIYNVCRMYKCFICHICLQDLLIKILITLIYNKFRNHTISKSLGEYSKLCKERLYCLHTFNFRVV